MKLQVKKEQLKNERSFISYCNDRDLGIRSADFLRALEKDGFLKPLLNLKEEKVGENGKRQKISIPFYSPHQVYIIAALIKNDLDDGELWTSSDDKNWYKQKGARMLNWGWHGHCFNFSSYKERGEWPFNICLDFYNFLKILHSLELEDDYEFKSYNKQRYLTVSPGLDYKLRAIDKEEFIKVIKKTHLNKKKLKRLRANLGSFARVIDPVASWFYYIQKHPIGRREEFKGAALLAQDIYNVCDLIAEFLEKMTGEKREPLYDFLDKDFYGARHREKYASGSDIKIIKNIAEILEKWFFKKENITLCTEKQQNHIKAYHKAILDFESRYGDRAYYSRNGMRTIEPEEDKKLEDLDEYTKRRALWGKDEKEFGAQVSKTDIAMAIEHSLDDLKRGLLDPVYNILKDLSTQEYNAQEDYERKKQMACIEFMAKKQELRKNDPSAFVKIIREFEIKGAKKELAKELKKIDWLKKKQKELGDIVKYADLVFCSVCRKNLIEIHQSYNDDGMGKNNICDECIKNKELTAIKDATWTCDYCGTMLYKFAYNNILDSWLSNSASANIELQYGKMKVRVRCHSRECKKDNIKYIDWGWLP